MKKVFTLMLLTLVIITLIINKSEALIIPDEALRIRVIANSNTPEDQYIKEQVVTNLKTNIYDKLKDSKNVSEAQQIIVNNLEDIKYNVKQTLNKYKNDTNFTVNFGQNYFPDKVYKGVTYQEGYYESLVVTLGEGAGNNFWCVLFPPLCLLEAEDSDEVEYKFFVSELIAKFLN
jgi:stage II sporulation protein R